MTERGALGVRAPAEHDGARRVLLGRDALQAVRPAHALRREPSDLATDVRRRRGDGVVVARLEPQHARPLRRPEPHGELGADHDRHFAEDVAGPAPADDPVDAVDHLDRLDAALEEGEEGALVALLRRVLAGQQGDVGRLAREPLAIGLVEVRRRP